MTYFENMQAMLVGMSNKARTQGGKAWDNAKGNNRRRHLPRGKVYQRFEQLHRSKWWRETKSDIDECLVKLGREPIGD